LRATVARSTEEITEPFDVEPSPATADGSNVDDAATRRRDDVTT
jgi:hypothetical protein